MGKPTGVPPQVQEVSVPPLPNELYRHRKTGGLYQVICTASVEATGELAVVYQSEQDKRCWTRPLVEFLDGRFERVKGGSD